MGKNSKSGSLQPRLDRRQFLGAAGIAGVAVGCTTAAPPGSAPTSDGLENAFLSPPRDARPGVFWHWINGQVSREGVTKDLEAMARSGIGRAVLFSIGLGLPPVPGLRQYRSLTPEWWEMLEHAVSEASRLDIDIAVAVCDGWATAAGPWITPDLSMQRLTSNAILVQNPTQRIVLNRPPAIENYYRDIRVLAFPIPDSWETSVTRPVTVSSSYGMPRAARLNSFDNIDAVVDTDEPGWIQFSFDRPFSVTEIDVEGVGGAVAGPGLELQASDDGRTFRSVGQLAQPRLADVSKLRTEAPAWSMANTRWVIDGAPVTTALHFRLAYSPEPGRKGPAAVPFDGLKGDPDVPAPAKRLQVSRIVLKDVPTIPKINERNAQAWALPLDQLDATILPTGKCVKSTDFIDLTDRVDDGGGLAWTPPDRRVWNIVRIGHTSTGAINGTGHPAGRGLESDKLRIDATRIQFDHWLGELARRVDKQGAGRALDWMLMDSWEAGSQNWSPALPEYFRAKRGYDIQQFMPLLVGVPTDSADVCERVLTDLRRTIGEMVQENFFGELKRLGEVAGYRFAAESANPVFPVDGLAAARHVDEPMGEFWLKGDDKPADIAEAIHGAHIYGRTLVGAESFTEFGMDWRETPFVCKPSGDANWAKGINRISCHVWASQPWIDEAHEPGMTLADIGVFFSRTNIWFEMSKPWFDYMRRGQALLQQGRPVADICCWIGENIPARAYVPGNTPLPIPEGYSFDSINSDVLKRLARVDNGDIVLPQGQRYRALVLPRTSAMTPEMMQRLAELAEAGAMIVGEAPTRSISFENYGEADKRVRELAQRLWGSASGSGQAVSASRIDEVLAERGVLPDVMIQDPGRTADAAPAIMWNHRTGDGWDLYFFSNQSSAPKVLDVAVRVIGRQPELWDANTGEIAQIAFWRQDGSHTHLELKLDAYGSAFVVLRKPAQAPILASISGDVDSIRLTGDRRIRIEASKQTRMRIEPSRGAALVRDVGELPEAVELSGSWQVTFSKGLPQPKVLEFPTLASWTAHGDPDVRHYAGVASYETGIAIDASDLRSDMKWILDLGDVAELCEVSVNGKRFTSLWKPPFKVDITSALVAGANRIKVDVVNTWRNRLIADAALPAEQRRSYLTIPYFRGAEVVGPSARSVTPPVYDESGYFLGGGFGNDDRSIPTRGSPAGTAPPKRVGESRYGFPGGGASAPTSAPFRQADANGLTPAGLLGPVWLRPSRIITIDI